MLKPRRGLCRTMSNMRTRRATFVLLFAALLVALPALAQQAVQVAAASDPSAATEAALASPSGCAETAGPSSFADELKGLLSNALDEGNLLFALLLVLLAGFGVTLTPCVYPLIPITLTIFGARQSPSKLMGFALSSTYVGGMVLLYSGLGIGFALAGQVMGTAMQNPFVTVGVALFCLVMASSMFGAFEMALPSSLQNRLSQVGGTGFKGAFLMGLVAGLIAAPCTGPVLTFILTLIARDGDVFKGGLLMVVFALGIGIPFLILGTFSSALSSIPKTGAWTEGVKSVFGLLMVGAGLYFLNIGVPQVGQTLAIVGEAGLWIAPALIVAGVAIGALHLSFKFTSPVEKARKGIGVALAIAGVAAFVGWTNAEPEVPESTEKIEWVKIGPEDDAERKLSRALTEAQQNERPVMIDFYADWCAACKELDKFTYTDPRVRAEGARFTFIKIDATDDTEPLKRIQKRFGVIGLPTVAFLTSDGDPCPKQRVTGFVEPEQYLEIMQSVR